MTFILNNQLPLLILFFVIGCIGTGFLFRKPAGHRIWKVADLVWVLLGGIGALGAIIAGVYTEDTGRIERQIDVAYSATTGFDRDAGRFRLGYCETASSDPLMTLCDKVDFLSASTANNAELPLFIAITDEIAPLSGLSLFSRVNQSDMQDMSARADAFDPSRFLVFTTRNAEIDAALSALRDDSPQVVADYLILAQSYDRLIAQISKLSEEWAVLQDNAFILVLQILSLSLVSFAAPFRLGKSIIELR